MAHSITLLHSTEGNDQIMYNGQILSANDPILVSSGDTLIFAAVGADWKLNLLLVDGDYDHSDVLIEAGTKIIITVISAPKEITVIEVECQICKALPLEAPKRIIISSTKMDQNIAQNIIRARLKRIDVLLHDLINM
ncbi:MAG: hypothetical protein IH620_01530 [Ignavibacterium sp.]|nr:hypothetical protein [Ignavibacterium sp.]